MYLIFNGIAGEIVQNKKMSIIKNENVFIKLISAGISINYYYHVITEQCYLLQFFLCHR